MLGAALAPLLAVGAQAGTNLVQNGSFSMNTLPSPLNPPDASGAEIDNLWNYSGDLTDWSSTASPSNPQLYNILFTVHWRLTPASTRTPATLPTSLSTSTPTLTA
jgi:hypothetical protein